MKRFFIALAFLLAAASGAKAQLPCSAYPNTLTNGTVADANQVMANFNNVLNCVDSLAPLGSPSVGEIINLSGALTGVSPNVTITADSIIVGVTLGGSTYKLTSFNQTFSGGSTGAGGMDTGALPSNGNVCLYAIYNPSTQTQNILGSNCTSSSSTVYSGGNMPAGYTASSLIGAWPTNGTPNLIVGQFQPPLRKTVRLTTCIMTATSSGICTGGSTIGSATYTPAAGITWFEIELIGGGGGGGGGNNNTASATAPTATTFGSAFLTAGAGANSSNVVSGNGGTTTGCGGVHTGGTGSPGGNSVATVVSGAGGSGASSPFGGAGGGGQLAAAGGGNGTDAAANSGAGGGGGSVGTGSTAPAGWGGSAGGYCRFVVVSPAASYAYAIGTGGTGATGGTNGGNGGAGGAGFIRIFEHYGF